VDNFYICNAANATMLALAFWALVTSTEVLTLKFKE